MLRGGVVEAPAAPRADRGGLRLGQAGLARPAVVVPAEVVGTRGTGEVATGIPEEVVAVDDDLAHVLGGERRKEVGEGRIRQRKRAAVNTRAGSNARARSTRATSCLLHNHTRWGGGSGKAMAPPVYPLPCRAMARRGRCARGGGERL